MGLLLLPYDVGDEAAAVRAHYDGFLLNWSPELPWLDWLAALELQAQSREITTTSVPALQLKAVFGGELIGRVSIRLALNDWLTRYGGHIGYYLRPSMRGQGHGTELLRQSLIIARALGVREVHIFCDDDNAASARVAERCGGILVERKPDEDGRTLLRLYVIGE
ncbi:MAG: GNAT family N-acetyltransferase [Acidimicrobiales bacterium]